MRAISRSMGVRSLAMGAAVCLLLALSTAGAYGQGGGGRGRGGGGDGDGGGGGGGPTTPLPGSTPLGLNAAARIPADNPLTPEKIALGRLLFFDPALSRDGTVACSTCHRPELAFADTARVSGGILGRTGARNSPTLFNRVYGRSFFWDGRAATLEQAVMMPIQDTLEMAMTLPAVVDRVAADARYASLFRTAFPNEAITELAIARALASYVRTLRAGNSAFDRFQAGDRDALSESANRGRALFFGRADCSDCHRGSNFTDEGFDRLALESPDPGRAAVTGSDRDRGEFKVPSLRDVAATAPYMHDGSLATLEDVVEFYDEGGALRRRGRRGGDGLGLSAADRADIVAFLRALSSDSRVF